VLNTYEFRKAQICGNIGTSLKVLACCDAGQARKLTKGFPENENWKSIQGVVMKVALRAKFDQHPFLAKFLMARENRPLDVASAGDTSNDGATDRLGELLVSLRDELIMEDV
jgi:predicted NAD-dependent protein-ADP-ribosyltransferase YbiA (DUF1768 family)